VSAIGDETAVYGDAQTAAFFSSPQPSHTPVETEPIDFCGKQNTAIFFV